MDITNMLISLVSGAVGGNVAGAALKDKSLGTVGNSLAGVLGGGVGGAILSALGMLPAGQIVGGIAGGGVGGAVVMAIIGFIKKSMAGASSSGR
jgi:uncharacterized membrane protein YeaQ/YmgE (transglycosylase-associated protein family)